MHYCASWGSSGSLGCVRSIPVRPGGRWVRSVHSCAPLGSSGSFRCVPSIPVCPGGRLFPSFTFCPFPCALGVVRFIPVRSVHYAASWGSFGAFSCALGVVGFGQVHYRALWGSPGSLVCVLSFAVCPGGRGIHSGAIPPHHGSGWVNSSSCGPFPCTLGLVRFLRVRWVHSRVPWGRRFLPASFGPLPCALRVVGFVRIRSVPAGVHSPAPWWLSGSFGCFRSIPEARWSIPVRPGCSRVRSVSFGPFLCALGLVGFFRVL